MRSTSTMRMRKRANARSCSLEGPAKGRGRGARDVRTEVRILRLRVRGATRTVAPSLSPAHRGHSQSSIGIVNRRLRVPSSCGNSPMRQTRHRSCGRSSLRNYTQSHRCPPVRNVRHVRVRRLSSRRPCLEFSRGFVDQIQPSSSVVI
jgi:hypothetical protein